MRHHPFSIRLLQFHLMRAEQSAWKIVKKIILKQLISILCKDGFTSLDETNLVTNKAQTATVRLNDFGDEEPKLAKELKSAGVATTIWNEKPTAHQKLETDNKNCLRPNVGMDNIQPVSNRQQSTSTADDTSPELDVHELGKCV